MDQKKSTQTEQVFSYMQEFGGITPLDAMRDLGVMRLASRISDLRKQGVPIRDSFVKVKNRYGKTCRIKSYSVMSPEEVEQA